MLDLEAHFGIVFEKPVTRETDELSETGSSGFEVFVRLVTSIEPYRHLDHIIECLTNRWPYLMKMVGEVIELARCEQAIGKYSWRKILMRLARDTRDERL